MGAFRLAGDFRNLREAIDDVEAVADGLGKALAEGIAQDAQPLLATAKELTPLTSIQRPIVKAPAGSNDATLDHVREMLEVAVLGGAIVIIAGHPGAKVHEWGGTIQPRGIPIKFTERAMTRRAAVRHLPEIERAVEARIEALI